MTDLQPTPEQVARARANLESYVRYSDAPNTPTEVATILAALSTAESELAQCRETLRLKPSESLPAGVTRLTLQVKETKAANDDLNTELSQEAANADSLRARLSTAESEVARLTLQVDSAEVDSADAQRWRWWREHATTRVALPMVRRSFEGDIPIDDKMLQWSAEIPGDLSTLFLSDPDAAIDAALSIAVGCGVEYDTFTCGEDGTICSHCAARNQEGGNHD